MKATVWTSWNVRSNDHDKGKPKCIFNGEILFQPAKGDCIIVRDGFCAETVKSVIHDFVSGEIEISVETCDEYNEYGTCLRDKA